MGGVCFNGAIITFIFYAWHSLKAHELVILYFYATALTREVFIEFRGLLLACRWPKEVMKNFFLDRYFAIASVVLNIQSTTHRY